jgi:hypothetical protein
MMCMGNVVNRKVERVQLRCCVPKGPIIYIAMWCITVALAVPLSVEFPGYGGATAADQTQFGNFHVRPSFLLMVAIE